VLQPCSGHWPQRCSGTEFWHPTGAGELPKGREGSDNAARGQEPGSPWLNLEGACAYLGFSRDQLYKLTAAHAIPFRKKAGGQGLRFHRDELDAWMETRYPRLDRLG
jgi:excisionase family DNA binding protein